MKILWNGSMSEEEKAHRRTKEAFLEDLKNLTTIVRASNQETFKPIQNDFADLLKKYLKIP